MPIEISTEAIIYTLGGAASVAFGILAAMLGTKRGRYQLRCIVTLRWLADKKEHRESH